MVMRYAHLSPGYLSEEVKKGLREKADEFRKGGGEIYRKG